MEEASTSEYSDLLSSGDASARSESVPVDESVEDEEEEKVERLSSPGLEGRAKEEGSQSTSPVPPYSVSNQRGLSLHRGNRGHPPDVACSTLQLAFSIWTKASESGASSRSGPFSGRSEATRGTVSGPDVAVTERENSAGNPGS